ncbi:MAG: hypothetical protein ABSH24_14345 [Bryobacteraceae bacterium]|jgi:hypothetical protein
MDAPLQPQPTLGRIFGSDWTIANVAKLLRFNAGQDYLRTGPLLGGLREISENYLRRTSARHLPSGVTVTFRRDSGGNWHAELCFAGLDHYLPWNDALAEEWLAALFLQDRPRVRDVTEGAPQANAVRHFRLVAEGTQRPANRPHEIGN